MINQKEIKDVDERVINALMQYSWPGNIRELENLVERAYILENTSVLTPGSFPSVIFHPDSEISPAVPDISFTLEKG